jgi:2-iminoacetate synthase
MAAAGAGPSEWTRDRIEKTARRICDPSEIENALAAGCDAPPERVREVLAEALTMQGITPEKAAVLLQAQDAALREEILSAARQVHEKAFGRRIGLVAPVCPTNRCINECLYCPLRRANTRLRRTRAGIKDIQREIGALLDEGYQQVMLVFGDDRSGVPYVRDMVWAAHGTRSRLRHIERVSVNLNPLRVDELRELAEAARLGTYHVFQETYHPGAYAALHADGPKADYGWRLTCHDRAHEAGVEDVGLGVLLGAWDFRFDLVAVLGHARYLHATFGRGPSAISLVRMVPTSDAPASRDPQRQVADEDFCFAVAVARLAMPCVDLILETPASRDMRVQLYALGISQVIVGSESYPGVYTGDGEPQAAGGLTVGRPRALETLVYRMCEAGFVPNLCVACFAAGRRGGTGRPGACQPSDTLRCAANALLALKEYLMDFASPDTQSVGGRLIQSRLSLLPEDIRRTTLELMEEAEAGLRGQVL